MFDPIATLLSCSQEIHDKVNHIMLPFYFWKSSEFCVSRFNRSLDGFAYMIAISLNSGMARALSWAPSTCIKAIHENEAVLVLLDDPPSPRDSSTHTSRNQALHRSAMYL